MKDKRILITGDDGYNAAGIKLLVALLKNDNELKIIGTIKPQSGTGGLMSFVDNFKYIRDEIEGVEAIGVGGSPVDAVNAAKFFYPQKFDLIISGVNNGENVSYAIISSGTFSAAVRGLGNDLATKAIILSKVGKVNSYFSTDKNLNKDFLIYPGEQISNILEIIEQNNYWEKELINVNFPKKQTDKYKLTKIDKNLSNYWANGKFSTPTSTDLVRDFSKHYAENQNYDINYDTGALNNGFISINPITFQ